MVDNMILTRIKRGANRTVVRLRNSTVLTSVRISPSFRRVSRNAGLSFLAGTTALLPLNSKALADDSAEPPSTSQAATLTGVAPEASAAVALQANALTVAVVHLSATSFTVVQSRQTEEEARIQAEAAQAAAEAARVQQEEAAKAAAEAEAARQRAIQAQQAAAAQAAAAQAATQASTVAVQAQDASSVQSLAYSMVVPAFGADQWSAFNSIVQRESGWNPNAMNLSSGAYGLGQALPGSKMAAYGADWRTNPATQVTWLIGYIRSRYGTPNAAWGFWSSHGWY
jgi:colicin import membrane protein